MDINIVESVLRRTFSSKSICQVRRIIFNGARLLIDMGNSSSTERSPTASTNSRVKRMCVREGAGA